MYVLIRKPPDRWLLGIFNRVLGWRGRGKGKKRKKEEGEEKGKTKNKEN